MMNKKAKRDFIFIDESGEPGDVTDYYIMGLIHVTDASLKKLNIHLGAFRYFGTIKKELKSTRLNEVQKNQLLNILKLSMNDGFLKASAIYINKNEFEGNYLEDKPGYPKDATRFRHFALRRLLEFHFQKFPAESREVELVIDRFHSTEEKEQQMRNYLRNETFFLLPNFLHITQVDSQYVELMQIADWISGSVKEKFFVHPERDYNELFNYINVQKVTI